MSWATPHIIRLLKGETVSFRPRGHSMSGKIEDGQLVTVQPSSEYGVGDIVLCKVEGRHFLHLVKAKREWRGKTLFLIGNNKGHINGWTSQIYGKVI